MPREATGAASRERAERWLAAHGDVLWRFCVARTRSVQAAEDVVQETLLAAMRGAERFEGASSEQTWLLGIAANKVADHFRRRAREGARLERDVGAHGKGCGCGRCGGEFTDDGRWARVEASWPAGDAAERKALMERLRACLDELPPAQAKLVWLRELKGVPSDEVRKVMGISETNMWTRMHRARASLRACLGRKTEAALKEGGA